MISTSLYGAQVPCGTEFIREDNNAVLQTNRVASFPNKFGPQILGMALDLGISEIRWERACSRRPRLGIFDVRRRLLPEQVRSTGVFVSLGIPPLPALSPERILPDQADDWRGLGTMLRVRHPTAIAADTALMIPETYGSPR